MAITRRQFVTRMGALAAAVGVSQADVSKLVDALAFSTTGTNLGGTLGKPRVVWIHGAECTGCSTSLLSVFEDVNGNAIRTTPITTAQAAGLAGILPTQLGGNDFTLHALGYNVEAAQAGASCMNIADVVVDVVDLQYHETVMGMGADLAAQWLQDFKTSNSAPFVLVVEGALQDRTGGGAWGETSNATPWCSIGMSADGSIEHDMAETVTALADQAGCLAVVPIGQCASFGGYPGCKPPITAAAAGGFDPKQSQTGALGTYDYLALHSTNGSEGKVVNVPGCPTNPWWFTLTVVILLVELVNGPLATPPANGPLGVLNADGSINGAHVDATRRLTYVYGQSIHTPACPRYRYYAQSKWAKKPGDPGCLQKLGCKGPATKSLCGVHGWNGQQPTNPDAWDYGVGGMNPSPNGQTQHGGHCTRAGHPCMACTEKGYPDSFVPFVVVS